MQEPEPELQATANLSPISPSPVHMASPLVVPALQNTIDTIDATVAAAAASTAQAHLPIVQHHMPVHTVDDDGDIIDDDDSFNDPYGDDPPVDTTTEPPAEQEDSDDDYAKTFDSPIGLEECEDAQEYQADVPSDLRKSNDISQSPNILTSHSSDAPPLLLDPSLVQNAAALNQTATQSEAEGAHNTAASQSAEPAKPDLKSASPPVHLKGDSAIDVPQISPTVNLDRFVAENTAQSADPNSNPELSAVKAENLADASSLPTPSSVLPSSSSLPPRPPQPNAASKLYPSHHHPTGSNSSISAHAIAPPIPGQPSTYVAAGAPGTFTDAIGNLPPPLTSSLKPPVAMTSLEPTPYSSPQVHGYPTDPNADESQNKWDQFLADERQYMSEAKWDRFPEGSRIFIGTRSASGASKSGAHIFSAGNLSSDKVSKRDVFEMFSPYGRLAQISLKSAYGFVQYHAVEEGQRAIDHMQGSEIKGRRIHLEVSKLQDKKKDRGPRSPDRGRIQMDRRPGHNDSYGSQNRDDYRSERSHETRRNDYNDGFGRDRGYQDSGRGGRGRSRSPGYGRSTNRDYRQRSPSPYGRLQREGELELPRRYGADVPDVQIILQPDVNRDFVAWVEGALKSKGLKTEVMFLHPRMPKDQVIQRQAVEGVHAVVDLDLRAQHMGKIPVQAFDRSAGSTNVRFDQYIDLDPGIAAEVILRTKASSAPSAHTYGQPYSGAQHAGSFGHPYGGQIQPPANNYNMPPAAYAHPQQPPQPQAAPNAADIASLISKVDNNTLQQLLSSIQVPSQGVEPPTAPSQGHLAPINQVDLQAILGNFGHQSMGQHQHPNQPSYGTPYGVASAAVQAPANGNSAAQVQNIMAQLARYRQ